MNERIKNIYAAVLGNEVVCFDTNLATFVRQFRIMEPKSRGYDWFYRRFKDESIFIEQVSDKVYTFQQLNS